MASLKTKFTVGLFVAFGLVVITMVVIWLGMSNYLEQGRRMVAYFDESVQGLGKDSPVKYRGVSIGRVESIGVAPDINLIQVVLNIESDLSNEQLQNDMVAQLKSVGITGIMFVEIERKTADMPDVSPKIDFPAKYPVIATRHSNIKVIFDDLEKALANIVAIDVQGISNQIKDTLGSIRQAVDHAGIRDISKDARAALNNAENALDPQIWNAMLTSFKEASESFREMAQNAADTVARANTTLDDFNQVVSENKAGIKEAVADFRQTVAGTASMIEQGNLLINNTDDRLAHFQRNMLTQLDQLARTVDAMNRFLEPLAEQPSQLVFGQPPAPQRQKDLQPETRQDR